MHQRRRQLTVALPNELGALAEVTAFLSRAGVNIDALSITDNIEQGHVRLVPDDPERCLRLLGEAGFYVLQAEVIEVDLQNRVGVLSTLSERLRAEGINIDYAYGSYSGSAGRMRLILRVNDIDRTFTILDELHERRPDAP